MPNVNRKDRLTYRQQQALATRMHIVANAKRLFLVQGYTSTTIEAIASEAGVAVSTVYAVFGNKRSILGAICEAWLEEAQIRPLMEQALAEPSIRERLKLAARWTRQQWERGAEVLPLLQAASHDDPEVAAMLASWIADKSAAMMHFVASLKGTLRPDLDVQRAGHIFDALTIPEIYRDLINRSGWSPSEYEHWLFETLANQLLTLDG